MDTKDGRLMQLPPKPLVDDGVDYDEIPAEVLEHFDTMTGWSDAAPTIEDRHRNLALLAVSASLRGGDISAMVLSCPGFA